MIELVADGHLGGYIAGGDPATWYPDLWRWFVDKLGVTSVIDVGCGEGHALNYFRYDLGCDPVLGIDGVKQDDSNIVWWDYTEGPRAQGFTREYDLVWCCEFVEHVEERHIPNFLHTFKQAPLVALTHAMPGQQGHHHVNCQPREYWVGVMAAIGYQVDPALTARARAQAAVNQNPHNHFVRSGLIFRRTQ